MITQLPSKRSKMYWSKKKVLDVRFLSPRCGRGVMIQSWLFFVRARHRLEGGRCGIPLTVVSLG